MKRILFVDDEPKVLEGLENMLFPYMDEFDLEFVDSGKAALERLAEEPFNVVVTDMRMPLMDGATLLYHVKERHPDAVRIVLSGHSEPEATLRAMSVAHQFLSKPCDADKLVAVIKRACELQDLINDRAVHKMVGTIGTLPARPQVFSELTRVLAEKDTSLSDVVAIVEQDIAISTSILQVVNTAFFSRGAFISSVQQAVLRLGATFIKNSVLATEVFREFKGRQVEGFSIDDLHKQSFLTAALASRLMAEQEQSDHAFLAGMLHDVGKLVLITALPDEFAALARESKTTGEPLFKVEYARTGTSHAEVGAYLLGLWGLPYPVIDAVANYHVPARAKPEGFGIVGAVHVANALIGELATGKPDPSLDLDYLQRAGVAHKLVEWRVLAATVANDSK